MKDTSQPIVMPTGKDYPEEEHDPIQVPEEVKENLSLEQNEIDFIRKALAKTNGKRKEAAKELGISERTLYRKIKEYNLEGT